MGDRKHHEPPPPSSAAEDLGLGLPTEVPADEQEAPGLKQHGDKLGGPLTNSTTARPPHHDPTAQPDGDDGDPATGARGPEELAETRGDG
jgi:hypothetical protein